MHDIVRHHPFMSYRGQPNWPPAWLWTGKGPNRRISGEVGVLNEVHVDIGEPDAAYSVRPNNRIYLYIEYKESTYVGCLLFDTATACRQIGDILARQCGKTLPEIGAIDLSHLL
jgi:hypothetical protein